ncbi:MAG: hypothetical protein HY537_00015 [Deltaproteobacteria bacterium]|nr:hypothetical protein [Deltaproteobacteria bacterium]
MNSVLSTVGLSEYHGPIVAAVIGLLMLVFFIRNQKGNGPPNILLTHKQRVSVGVLALLVIIGAITVRVRALEVMPVDVKRADMIPTVQSQIVDFLEGNNPYSPRTLQEGHTVPRYYLPIIWLTYTPLYVLGIDIRYLNIAAQVILYLLLLDCFLRKGQFARFGFRVSVIVFIALLAMHAFSKQAIREVTDTQTGPFWLFYCLFLWAMSRQSNQLSFIFLSLVVLCRHAACLLFLPLALYFAKSDRKKLASMSFHFILIACVVLLPFFQYWRNLWEGIAFYSSTTNQTSVEQMMGLFGLAGPLKKLGLLFLQKPLQLSGTLYALWAVLFSMTDPLGTVALGGVAYLTVILFVGTPFHYLYAEPLILSVFLLVRPSLRRDPSAGASG